MNRKKKISETATRYEEARGVFYDRYMVLSHAVRRWQIVSFALLAVITLLAALSLHLARSQRLIPYVVEKDALGRAQFAGALSESYIEDDALIAAQLSSVIMDLRTIYQDAAAQTDMIERAYQFVTPQAATFLSSYFENQNPIELGKRLIRRVEIEHVIRVPGSRSWNVTWRESEIGILDGSREESAWQAYLTITFSPPESLEEARLNPLGLFISGITWSKEL